MRRGVASIIALIFLVMLMGISMMAFIVIYNEYKSTFVTEAQMSEWETKKSQEKLVKVETGVIGAGNISKTFYVSEDSVSKGYFYSSTYEKPPRLYRYDQNDLTYTEFRTNILPPYEIDINFSIITDKINLLSNENWSFKLIITCKTPDPGIDLDIYAYNFDLNEFDEIRTIRDLEPGSWYNIAIQLDSSYVRSDGYALIRVHSYPLYHHLLIDRLILIANYSYVREVNYTIFKPADPKLMERDGDTMPASPLIDVTIDNVTWNGTLRDMIGFITLGNSHPSLSREVTVGIYNYTKNDWDYVNTTTLEPYTEYRIRIPSIENYISSDNKVRLQIKPVGAGGGNIVVDEVVIEAIWIKEEGTRLLTIKNESPFTSRIVRIWYIGENRASYQDFSPPLALQPGETYTVVLPAYANYIKVITDYGNIFAFYP